MSERVTMPALGESVTEGTVTRWLKNVGDTVEVDEPLLEVSTDKVDTEIPSPIAGVLQEILAEEDDTVEVGGDLAVISDGSEDGDSSGGDAAAEAEEPAADEAPAEEESAEEPAAEEAPAEEAPAEEESAEEAPAQGGGSDSGGGDSGGGDSGGGDSGGGETVTMPALGESVTEGTVTRWLKAEGDDVEVDEPLLEVSTDKVDTEIPSPVAGKLTKILAQEDETVEVGGELAVIGGSGGDSAPAQEAPAEEPKAEEPKADEPKADEPKADEPKADESAEQSDQKQEEATQSAPDLAEDAELHDQAADESAKEGGEKTAAPSGDSPGTATGVGTPEQSGGDVSAYVTPLVRKLAAQHKVDLNTLSGTGVGGRIRKQDVLDAARKAEEAAKSAPAAQAPAAQTPAAASAPAPSGGASAGVDASPKRGTTEKMSRLRKLIANRMVESLQTSAQLTTVIEVDLTKVARLRNKTKDDFLAREGVKLSYMPFFVLAAVEALKVHPNVNASVEEDQVIYHPTENVGIAVDTEKGLIVPVIKDAGDLNIAGISRKIADLAERTRTNKVMPDELGGGTFTITNTGSRGALFDTPIINQPQVAILGTGSVVKRPVVVIDEDGGETIAIRSMVYLALTYDHRIVDGADAARFLSTVKERLEDGSFEV